ncbi:MAG: HEAT repeat domain-containing protein [Candidatus Aminicenantes bacterium]|jgi:HEAT repeat protein
METADKIAKDRAKTIRRHRTSALRKIKDAKDKHKRLKIIKHLFAITDPWANEVLLEALADSNEEIRSSIIQELGRRADLDMEMVCQKLYHPHWYVKSSALKILALQKSEKSLFHIQTMITDPNVEVRRGIADCLGDIGGDKALSLLLSLEKDDNPFVQTCAEASIRKISKIRFT